MEGKVVVVFYWLEADGFAEEAEMVDWDGGGEEGCYRCERGVVVRNRWFELCLGGVEMGGEMGIKVGG